MHGIPTFNVAPNIKVPCAGVSDKALLARGVAGVAVDVVVDVAIEPVNVSLEDFFKALRTVPAFNIEPSLVVELVGVKTVSCTSTLVFPFSFVGRVVVILGAIDVRVTGGKVNFPTESRFSAAFAAAAFPTAFRLVIDTVDIFEWVDMVEGGRLGTGGNFFVLVLGAAKEALEIVRLRPAVVFDAIDATELRRESGISDLAV